ncbi:MAG: universal stress protein, partial [Pseudomonadota bacterium]
YDASVGPYAFDGGAGAALLELSARAKAEALRLSEEANAALLQAGALGEAIPVVAGTGEVPSRVARYARYADLVVTVPGGDGPLSRIDHDFVEAALFEGDTAVLFQPEAGPEGDTVLVGWDGSREAMHAVRHALPVLTDAGRVEIVTFGEVVEEETPGEQLALMLSRHGIAVEIAPQPAPHGTVAEALARRAMEIGARLTVIGAYGHSRFREALIGGVTRDLLNEARIAVLMAH